MALIPCVFYAYLSVCAFFVYVLRFLISCAFLHLTLMIILLEFLFKWYQFSL